MKTELEGFVKYLVEFQWSYVAYALPALFILILFYFRNRKRIFTGFSGFINWLKPSFETGGFASPEKITAAMVITFAYLPGNILIMLSSDAVHRNWALGINAVFVLVLFRIITPQQLAELKNGISPSKPNTPDEQQNR